jgi:hypothetical protein
MKLPAVVISGVSLAAVIFGSEIKPVDSDEPVLEFYESASNAHLTVSSIRYLIPHVDGKGVTVVLNEADKNQFAALVRSFPTTLMRVVPGFESPPGIGVSIAVEQLTRASEAGLLSFGDFNGYAEVATYLRNRFGRLPPEQTMKPVDSDAPILQYFSVTQTSKPSEPAAVNFDPRKPLLTISTIRDLITAANGKGVAVVLTESDAKKFAEFTRKLNGQILLCRANTDKIMSIGHVTAPTENGIILFSEARKSGNIADYLRKRFGK